MERNDLSLSLDSATYPDTLYCHASRVHRTTSTYSGQSLVWYGFCRPLFLAHTSRRSVAHFVWPVGMVYSGSSSWCGKGPYIDKILCEAEEIDSIVQHRTLPGKAVNFIWLHETARHAIHCSETIDRTITSLDAMLQHSSAQKSVNNYGANTITRLQFQLQMLRGLLLRSQANKDRLSNEVTLVGTTLRRNGHTFLKIS